MTKTWARRTAQAGAIAAGVLLVSAGAAQAYGTDLTSVGNVGVGNGNQVYAPIQAPIDVCGNAVSVLGGSLAGCQGGSQATLTEAGGAPDLTSAGNIGVGNGNQVYAPIQAPINVCGNSVAVLGGALSGCEGGAHAKLKNGNGAPDATSLGNVGLGNGNQAIVPTQVPVDVSGNGVAAGGLAGAWSQGGSDATMWANHGESKSAEALPGVDSLPTAGVSNLPIGSVTNVLPTDAVAGATKTLPTSGMTDGVTGKVDQTKPVKPAKDATKAAKPESKVTEAAGAPDLTSLGNVGLLNGNQVYAPIQVPVDVSGNAVAVGGGAAAGSQGGSHADHR